MKQPAPSATHDWLSWRFYFNRWGRQITWPEGHRLTREWCSRVLIDHTFYFLHSGENTLINHATGETHFLYPGLCMMIPPGADLEFVNPNPHVRATFFHWDFSERKRGRDSQLLRHSDLTIGMIAETLGYEDVNYFSRQFRKVARMTAKEYRKGKIDFSSTD